MEKNRATWRIEHSFRGIVRGFVKRLPRTIGNTEDVRQLIRASGSVAANWVEADEALSKRDFLMRVKICRKEREPLVFAIGRYWINEK